MRRILRDYGWMLAMLLLLVGSAVAQTMTQHRSPAGPRVPKGLVVWMVDPVTGQKTRVQ